MIGRHPFAVRGPHRRRVARGDVDRHCLIVQIPGAAADRVGSHGTQQAVCVEPALVLQAQRDAGEALRVQPRKLRGDLRAFEQRDVSALGDLHVAVGTQRRLALRGWPAPR